MTISLPLTSDPDRYASWLLLELAQEGRPVEHLAQFIASYMVSSDEEWSELTSLLGQVFMRVSALAEDTSEIWQHLLPGGSQGDPLEHPDTTKIKRVVEILSSGDAHEEAIVLSLTAYLMNEGAIHNNVRMLRHRGAEVTVIAETPDNNWLVCDKQGQLYAWVGVTFTNISNPDDSQLSCGHHISVDPDELQRLDGSEVYQVLN